LGESAAALFLERRGFKILKKNFWTRWGEIDIIAERGGAVHFIEVKTRSGLRCGEPEEAINYFKLRRLRVAAEIFLKTRQSREISCQFDSLAVLVDERRGAATLRFKENIVS